MLGAPAEQVPGCMAASLSELSEELAQGKVRQDLYYRLSGAGIQVPALRERVEDIPLLARHFLNRAEQEGGPRRKLQEDAVDLLRSYSWPGNVRQLENAVRRLLLSSQAEEITRSEIEMILGTQPGTAPALSGSDTERLSDSMARHLKRYFDLHGTMLPPPGLYARILREMELPLLEIALGATGGNQAKCADLLGINRNTLRKKITDLDIQVTRRRKLM